MGWLRRLFAALLPCLALALSGLCAPNALAADSGGVTIAATAGFGGLARAGHTLPITVDVSNTGADRTLDLTAEAQTSATAQPRAMYLPAVPYRARYHLPVTLPHSSHKRVILHLPLSSLASGILVQAWQGTTLVATTTAPLTEIGERQPFAAVVSDRAAPLPGLAGATLPGLSAASLLGLSGGERPAVATLLPTALPTDPDELEELDMLVLTHATTQALSAQQQLALQGWTAAGGTLVLSGGADWPLVSAGLPRDLLPAPPDARLAPGDLAALAAFADAPAPAGPTLIVAGARGRTLAGPADAPLLTQLPYGAGSVIFSAADLAAEPLLDWPGGAALWQRILTVTLPAHLLTGATAPQQLVSSFDPISNLLANVPQATPRAWPGLAALLAGYVVALPLLLLLLRRIRRSALGLALLPVAALGVAALAFGVAVRERGGPVVVDAVTVTEVPPGAAVAHVSAYYALFAPADHAYHLQFAGGGVLTALNPPFVKRLLRPGDATTPAEPPLGLDLRQDGAADLLPIDQWVDRGVARQRWIAGANPVQARVDVTAGGVSGVITNTGAQPLEDAAVLSPWGVVELGTLAPGRSAPFDLAATAGLLPTTTLPNYGGSPGGVPPEQFRAEQFRQQLMNALSISRSQSGETDAALGPLQLIAWTAPAEPAPQIDGRSVAESGAGLLLVGLPVPAAANVPPGLLPAHLESILGATTGQGSQLALNNAALTATALLPPLAVARSVTLRVALVNNVSGALLSVSVYNRITGNYDSLRAVRRVAAPVGPSAPTNRVAAPGSNVVQSSGGSAVRVLPAPVFRGPAFVQMDAVLGPGDLAAYVGSDGTVRFRIDSAGNATLALPITYGYATMAAPL